MLSSTDARVKRNRKSTQTATGADLTLQQMRLLTAEQVSHLCSVDRSTVWRWAARVDNALPAVRIGKRCTRFRACDVLAFIEGAMNG